VRPTTAALTLLAAAALAGCGALDPFATVPAVAGAGEPQGSRVAICYNAWKTETSAVQAEAQRECPAGTAAQAVGTGWHLQYCPVLLPVRASFVCTPAAPAS
jgi:hypothetical protein